MGETEDITTVELPSDLVDRVERRIRYTEFEDVCGYVEYVLEEVLYAVEEENDLSEMVEVDEGQVRDRLKSLGYLNE